LEAQPLCGMSIAVVNERQQRDVLAGKLADEDGNK
jgi:hypothetical protein